MRDGSKRTIAVTLQASRIERGPDGWVDVDCLGCGESLEFHQPDPSNPDRLLGTCEACNGWVVAGFSHDRGDGAAIFLPIGEFMPSFDVVE